MTKNVDWQPVADLPPCVDEDEPEFATTSGYLWLYNQERDYFTMGWYDSKNKKWFVDSKDFEPTHWAAPVKPDERA